MAWTTPITWSTAQIVTATELNEQVRDNENFLYDSLNLVTVGTTSNILNTAYQNTTGVMKYVSVQAYATTGTAIMAFYVGTTSPPTQKISAIQWVSPAVNDIGTIAGMVPPNYYYTASTQNFNLNFWVEYNLHAT